MSRGGKKIRVLQCIRQGQVGGGESHLLSLSANLNKDIFEPVVLSFTDGPMIGLLQEQGIKTHIIHTEKPFNFFVWGKVKKLVSDEKIDLIHAHGTRAHSNVFWAARSLDIPLVYTVHGWSFHDDQNPFVKRMRILGEKFLVSRSDVNISVSESNRQTGRKYIRSFRSEVVNNGINREKFNPANRFRNIREDLGIEKNALLLLFIARFTSHKQPLALIQAMVGVVKEMPGIRLLMVGDGDEKSKALLLAKQLCLDDSIIFEPFRQDVPDILNAADIYILPSLWEGLPIGLLEAMSMGKAVIATNVDGTCEIIRHQENGYLIQPENVQQELTRAILTLAADPVRRAQYGSQAVETVKNHFDAGLMTRQIEQIYTRLSR